ncbi:hypothetical protein K432DRAFT_396499 [Lepidopterella palustris CBS 459.81]|uniref:Uncharacterized protein n=1 Tax=Lepidopterella palustris CBS 459.81 TaxID=1314670 RepID=A0A8E2E335_9PEZI|nr:hypothetical protein K432DRAFT_396499 [Lepidopterella palustris CBS 459.81]
MSTALANIMSSFKVSPSLSIPASCSAFQILKHRGVIEGNSTSGSPPAPSNASSLPPSPSPTGHTNTLAGNNSQSMHPRVGIGVGADVLGLLCSGGITFILAKWNQLEEVWPEEQTTEDPAVELPANKGGS